ncbi:uncharacterized protein LOC134244743 [Saccostrea cucullata]|uniref:uncharacterized protein LOC134244743 n=1 Tax=Saccostrea cuccullata TaxID=36930 RepID=UPI002ED2B914
MECRTSQITSSCDLEGRKKERAECFQLHIFCTVTCYHKDQISSTRVVLTPKFSQFVKSTSSDTREECGVNANKGSTAGVYLTSRQFLVITIRMTDSEDQLQGDSYALRSFADGLKLFRKKSSYHSHRFLACVQKEHRCNDETISRQMGGP